MRAQERLSEHTKRLPPLKVGDHVRIQNQIGPYPLKWDKTGIIVEVRQYDQYIVRTDGSNRTTLRNRKFLRKFIPARVTPPPRSIIEDLAHQREMNHQQAPVPINEPPSPHAQPIAPPPINSQKPPQSDLALSTEPNPSKPGDSAHDQNPDPAPRRSSRTSTPPSRLSYQTMGTPSIS